MVKYPSSSPIIVIIKGFKHTIKILIIIEIIVVIINELVTEYFVSSWVLFLILIDVIFDMVRGILAPTKVIRTVKMDNDKLYIPSSVVVIMFDIYILNMNPRHLVATLNNVSVSIAFNNFLIISPPQ